MTNADGRSDALLLDAAHLEAGCYELHFEVAAYFRARGVELSGPAVPRPVTLRFGIADAAAATTFRCSSRLELQHLPRQLNATLRREFNGYVAIV